MSVGFEPTDPCGPSAFKADAIDHSANSPKSKLLGLLVTLQEGIVIKVHQPLSAILVGEVREFKELDRLSVGQSFVGQTLGHPHGLFLVIEHGPTIVLLSLFCVICGSQIDHYPIGVILVSTKEDNRLLEPSWEIDALDVRNVRSGAIRELASPLPKVPIIVVEGPEG